MIILSQEEHKEVVAVKRLTKRQKEILKALSEGQEITYEKGAGWWLENDRISGKVVFSLLRHYTLKKDQYSNKDVQRYSINETGRKSLETGWLYSIVSIPNE